MTQIRPRVWTIAGIAAVVILIDWVSKRVLIDRIPLGESVVVAPFFHLTHVHNTGSAFGLFAGNNRALLLLAFAILGLLLYSARGLCEQAGRWGTAGVGLVTGGAVGNIIDRIAFGHVVDFFNFLIWPVFNVADSAISVGSICLAIGLLRRPPQG